MTISKITTHVTNAADRTLSQYDASTRLKALIQFFAEQHQDLEDVLYALLVNMTLDTAVGDMLEKYGVIVGWPRVAVIDDDTETYRSFLNTAIKVNISDARAITVLEIMTEYLTGLFPGTTTTGDPEGPELVSEGDMESDPLSVWTAFQSSVTQEPGAGGGTGGKVLRVTWTGTSVGAAVQTPVMTNGLSYHLTGWARGDGTTVPELTDGPTFHWTGTSSTVWQEIDVTFEATGPGIYLACQNLSISGWVEFDDISCVTESTEVTTQNTIVKYTVTPPASFEMQWFSDYLPTQLEINRINQILERITPLGVGSSLTQGASSAFILDSATRGLDAGTLGRRLDVL